MEIDYENFKNAPHKNILKLVRSNPIKKDICDRVEVANNNSEVTKIKADGISYPYRDSNGKIVSYRVGLANPIIKEDGKKIKYLQEEGVEATPFYDPIDRERIYEKLDSILVTEGEKKLLSLKSHAEFDSYPVVSFPGAHNWQIKGSNGKLSPAWSSIKFNGRRVIIVADTDIFLNFQVYLGYIRFIKQILDNGAVVELVDLRPSNSSSEEKIGVDDAIAKFGTQYVIDKIENPCWKFNSIRNFDFDPDNYKQLLLGLVACSKAEQAVIFDQLKTKDSRFNKGTAKLVLAEIQKEWALLKPAPKEDGNAITWNSDEEPLKVLFKKIGHQLSKIPDLYRYTEATTFVYAPDGKPKILSTPGQLEAFMANHVTYRKARIGKDGEELLSIEHIPENHLLGVIENIENISEVTEVNFITSTPQVFENRIISEQGYDVESKILYVGEALNEISEKSYLNLFLDSFPFETDIDRLNCLGIIVSFFYVQKYVGQHPAAIIQGDQQSLGKTELARSLALLFQSKEAQLLSWVHDEELKKIASACLADNDFLIIDNVKAGRDSTVISSQAFEGLITAPMLTFRVLGENRVFSRPNNAVFCFTLNKGVFSDDLVVRSIAISLSKEKRQVMKDDFSPVDFVKNYRSQILGEVSKMIKKSFVTEFTPQLVFKEELGNFKFRAWANEIQRVLLANGKSGFLTNQGHLARKMSPVHNAIENFIVRQIIDLNRTITEKFSASQILKEIPYSVFNGDQNFASQVSLVGRALTNIKTVSYDGEFIDVERHPSSKGGKSYVYSFSLRTGASE